jgi:hypothetical protein
MPDDELIERHDAQVARARETGEVPSQIYLGELARRMAELQTERLLRIALAALALTCVVLVFTVLIFFIVV